MPLEIRLGDEPGLYFTVAAGQTDQILTGHPDATKTGIIGDYIADVLVIPGTTAAGSVSIKDGSTAITLFNGTGTLSDLKPFSIPVRMRAKGAGWKITTGTNVSAIVKGIFSYS